MPRKPASETFDEFLEYIEPYIHSSTIVRTGVVQVKLEFRYSKSYIKSAFRKAMMIMVEQGKAREIEKGRWEILKVSKVA